MQIAGLQILQNPITRISHKAPLISSNYQDIFNCKNFGRPVSLAESYKYDSTCTYELVAAQISEPTTASLSVLTGQDGDFVSVMVKYASFGLFSSYNLFIFSIMMLCICASHQPHFKKRILLLVQVTRLSFWLSSLSISIATFPFS